MSATSPIDYEHLPGDGPLDETDVSLRAYLARLSDEHLSRYDPAWTDVARPLAEVLTTENTLILVHWAEALHPARPAPHACPVEWLR